MIMTLFRSVTKILTHYRFNFFGWGLDGQGSKTVFFRDTNLDQLTLGGSETHIFEGVPVVSPTGSILISVHGAGRVNPRSDTTHTIHTLPQPLHLQAYTTQYTM